MDEKKFFEDIGYRLQCYNERLFPVVEAPGNAITDIDTPTRIVIPTLGREENQLTFSQLPEKLLPITYLATKKAHVGKLQEFNSSANILELPDETHGIADTRQRCIEALPKGRVWMIDDSVKFQRRQHDYRVLGWATEEEILQLYDLVSYLLRFYVQVGVSDRPGNNRVKAWKKDNARAYTIYGLRTDILDEAGITFDHNYRKHGAMFFEDYYLTLALLTRGYSNTVIYDFVSSVGGRNNKGGNSHFRNNEQLKKSVEALIEEFPAFVQMKEIVSNWQGLEGTRYEPKISWKRAFESSQQPKVGPLF